MQTNFSSSYSVLMSIYKKENPAFLIQALDSMLNQTVSPAEIVMVKDGPLTHEIMTSCIPDCSILFRMKKTMDLGMHCAKASLLALTKLLHAWTLMI